jgi:hypothetical protein
MNRGVVVAAIGVAVVGGALLFWQSRTSRVESSAKDVAQPATSKAVLGVEEFMREVDNYPGQVRLEGVVSAVAAEERALTLIDVAELERCGVVTCAPLSLPVQWNGEMPAVRDVVLLKGEVSESEGKLFFLAHSLERIEPKLTETP